MALHHYLRDLSLETSKLTLKEVLEIGHETNMKVLPSENVSFFLKNVLSLNANARDDKLEDKTQNELSEEIDIQKIFQENDEASDMINPLDVECVLLHCSDQLLQQQIIRRMFMCQFAVPLILPAGDGSDRCTFMLWALRDIVTAWRPKRLAEQKSYVEGSIVQLPLPVMSFVRLGKNNLSKSGILNKILSPKTEENHYFIDKEMNSGNVKRQISDGLVEAAWYFSSGRNSDLFPGPITFANLRGDVQRNKKQFQYLTKMSKIVFIFINNSDEAGLSFTDIDASGENLFFIISLQSSKIISGKFQTFLENVSCMGNENYLFAISKENKYIGGKNAILLSKMFPHLKMIMLETAKSPEKQIASKLQLLIKQQIIMNEDHPSLEDTVHVAYETGIDIDENSGECKDTRELSQNITVGIGDVVRYKTETMKLQDLWKQISLNEKELCRLRNQGNISGEQYKSQIKKKILDLRRQQNKQELFDGMKTFLHALINTSKEGLSYFFKWMRLYLDSKSRKGTSEVKQTNIKELCQDLSRRSLGIEHFLRELGQCYEAERCMIENKEIFVTQKRFNFLPGIAADLLLNGLPLELVDGDASSVPIRWITEVLQELNKKTGGKCRIRVISVLGVQSTGKSTLLNTMFGLQCPVGSAQCTRGAFMTLLKVQEDSFMELGCNYILVLDTQGLRDLRHSITDRSENDNELSTLVVGLSDITIVNIAMENMSEIKDILMIVAHALLRMKKIGKKTRCLFVHQNVPDTSAHDKIRRERQLLLEYLNEMTKDAAKMEKCIDAPKFTDIIDYDIEKDSWYIPGLWHGVPPMASISPGYSEKVHELKVYVLEVIKQSPQSDSCNIKEFIEWIKSLWNAVKHENFLFSFRSSLEAIAYNQLCAVYSQQEWQFRNKVYKWRLAAENRVKNQMLSKDQLEVQINLNSEIEPMLQKHAQIMQKNLEDYFKKDDKYVKLMLKYKEEFLISLSRLQRELKFDLQNKILKIIHCQVEISKIKAIQEGYQKTIEEQVRALLEKHKDIKLSDEDLESEFMMMWDKTAQDFKQILNPKNIGEIMLDHLKKDMRNKAGYINEILVNLDSFKEYQERQFELKIEHFQGPKFQITKNRFTEQFWDEAKAVVLTIIDRCNRYITSKVATEEDYNDTFCQQLINIVNDSLKEELVQKFDFNTLFELDVKLFILAKAAQRFQKMHEDFIQRNDPGACMENLKHSYLKVFKEVYYNEPERERAKIFCELCLKPALIGYVFSNFGNNIVSDILIKEESENCDWKDFFHNALLTDLLKEKVFSKYVKYCLNYEIFAKEWIMNYITERCKKPGHLSQTISDSQKTIITKVTEAFEAESVLRCSSLSDSLKTFCEILNKYLVISQNDMRTVTLPDTKKVHQFFQYAKEFLVNIKDQVQVELTRMTVEDVLSKSTINPLDELFRKAFGCGKQCPFCKVPCEAGGPQEHPEHFATIHRPQGLGRYRSLRTHILCHELCTTDVIGNREFKCKDTNWKCHPYKDYREIYPKWKIQPDEPDHNIGPSDYWKYVFNLFNEEFAKEYKALPAELPEDWSQITEQQALDSIKKYK